MLKNDVEAPKYMVLNYEPYDKCEELMKQGVTCICVTKRPTDNRPPIQNDLYPTGEWTIMREEGIWRLLPEEDAEQVIEKGMILLGEEFFHQIMPKPKKHDIFDRLFGGHIFYRLFLWK